jgi:hypothetical protein
MKLSKELVTTASAIRDDLDAVFAIANPNPRRLGCPTQETVKMLAARAFPIGHLGYRHLAECSPCFREFLAFQEALPITSACGTSDGARR